MICRSNWVAYPNRPSVAKQVVHYVGRYTHRVAINNNRLAELEGGTVRFRWKDYRHGKSAERTHPRVNVRLAIEAGWQVNCRLMSDLAPRGAKR
ncbi:transposase [Bradyrhizobium zhanjiangense]|uniref:transposase n=1 Tax=Bradyrhizobium zhanjiangense TaxID=1325107 RepID=UPI003D32226C